ncbi:hypothetical protein AB1Y20_002199 [Prymnesium parvum]|uniref:Uncharacterized protein n=1 Tax=Prymnesium parvum TaxID=97485 RepID=A0AB34J8G7_PRYPA|mmetsp:Transcript_56305/g.99438  ORF Transcript_56305/g.99438 Transcript_56305/m.99438 type:complete len:219 (+) Transcript_56305:74-730(+)
MLALLPLPLAFSAPAAAPLARAAVTPLADARVASPVVALAPQWRSHALAALAAASIVFSPLQDANAASRSGGRVGGRAPAVSRSAPSSVSPSRGTTNVIISQPPMGMGYGYGGYGYGGYGGYGYGGGGGNGLGLYLGLSLAETFLREQQRQAYLQQQLKIQQQMGADQAAIANLERQLAEQNSKVEQLRSQQTASDAATIEQLKAQLAAEQQKNAVAK